MSIPVRGEIIESENPLDVLSRAATMVEKSEISPRLSPPIIEKSKVCERSPSFKERTHPKFRKSSTPDYMVALESARSLKRQTSLQSEPSERMDTSSPNNNSMPDDVPLDMSIKKRPNTPPPPPHLGPPPQYGFNPMRQHSPPAMNPSPPHFRPPVYKSPPPYPSTTPSPPSSLPPPPSYEESTVKCTYPTKNTPPPAILQHEVETKTKIKEITIITNSSADPLLDEHFRRSLGADYESLFKKKSSTSDSESSSTESTPPKVPQMPRQDSKDSTSNNDNKGDNNKNNKNLEGAKDSTQVADPVKAFREDMELEGYTVEDHFAKALGDTWIKLQKAEEEKRSKKSEDNTKPTVMASS